MTSLDLGLIGNGTIGALLDPVGEIVWACFPRFDGDPAFCSLLRARTDGDDFGYFAVELMDRQRQLIDLKAFVNEVLVAQNLVLVKTPPGHANGVARAIDLLALKGIVGSVAGDDTVLVVTADNPSARRFKRHLDTLASPANGTSK